MKEAPGREKTGISQNIDFYDQLGQDCATAGVRVDLFMAHNSKLNLATIGKVVRLTGGQVRLFIKNKKYKNSALP